MTLTRVARHLARIYKPLGAQIIWRNRDRPPHFFFAKLDKLSVGITCPSAMPGRWPQTHCYFFQFLVHRPHLMFDKSQWNSAKGVALKNAQDQSRIASIIKQAPNQEVFAEQWERAWRMHWEKTGFTPYELPISDSAPAGERELLTQARTLEGERFGCGASRTNSNTDFGACTNSALQ